jgi:hypothetical protein
MAGDSPYLLSAEAAAEQYLPEMMNNRRSDASDYLHRNPCL